MMGNYHVRFLGDKGGATRLSYPTTDIMVKISDKMILKAKNLILVLLTIQITSCTGQVKEKSIPNIKENEINTQPIILNQNTTFPQIHTNLNGMVREFVRTMHQDKKGNYWFGTNGDGIIRYDGQILEKITIAGISPHFRVLEIVVHTPDKLTTLFRFKLTT
jgi:hypothetical protein